MPGRAQPHLETVGVIGGGAWGTALAAVAAANGGPVMLWAREPEVVAAIQREHRNPVFLPTVPLFADEYRRNRTTGSFLVIEESTGATVGAGMVL